MAEAKKEYPYSSVLLYNLACDIVEMYKAKITQDRSEHFGFITEMYGQETSYIFCIKEQPDGCLLSIETEGENAEADKQLSFMFSIVDNMLARLPESG